MISEKTALLQQHEQAVSTMQSQIRQQQEYENLVESSETQHRELLNELELERNRAQQFRDRIKALERSIDLSAREVTHLRAKIDQAQSALQTPLGKGFILLSRLLGGQDLSDL